MTVIDLVTISREYGAGASDLARRLGERLGWRVIDSQIPAAVATRLGIPLDALGEWDEHAPGLLESIGHALVLGSPEILLDSSVTSRPDARRVANVTSDYLRAEAETPRAVIVGHGAQALFASRAGTLHLRLVAPLAVRAKRVAARRGCSEQHAMEICRRVDADRMHYVKDFHGRDVRDPLLYDLQINTGRVEMADAAILVSTLADAR